MRLARLFPLCIFPVCLLGCSAEGAVSLTGSIGNVSVAVSEQGFVANLEGGFDVYLELGERASGASDVSFSTFSLVRADTGAAVLAKEHLSVVGSKATPLRIQPGGSTTIHFDIGDQAQPGAPITAMELPKDDFAALCGAGSLQIIGTLQDSADGQRPSTLSSVAFSPNGCP